MHSGLNIEAVVACSQYDYAIGKGNTLPWSLPNDLQRFKRITQGGVVIMGRKTAESLPRALPGRLNIVLTRSGSVPHQGMIPVTSFASALAEAKKYMDPGGSRTIFIIGGEAIYEMAIPYLTGLHLTKVDVVVDGADAYWPMGHFTGHVLPWQLVEDPRGWYEEIDNGVPTRYMHYQINRELKPVDWVDATTDSPDPS